MLSKLYPTSPLVSHLFEQLLTVDFTIISISEFYIRLQTEFFIIKAWNTNLYYAWLRKGSVTRIKDQQLIYNWCEEMPSLKILRRFKKLLKPKLMEYNESLKQALNIR